MLYLELPGQLLLSTSIPQRNHLGCTVKLQCPTCIPGYFYDAVWRVSRKLLSCDGTLHGIKSLIGNIIGTPVSITFSCP